MWLTGGSIATLSVVDLVTSAHTIKPAIPFRTSFTIPLHSPLHVLLHVLLQENHGERSTTRVRSSRALPGRDVKDQLMAFALAGAGMDGLM
jgi:hypothetical protein